LENCPSHGDPVNNQSILSKFSLYTVICKSIPEYIPTQSTQEWKKALSIINNFLLLLKFHFNLPFF